MDDEQLRKMAQVLVNDALEKAVDKVRTEKRQMDEGLDQGVDDTVGLTIGRSINAIREGQTLPTGNKMEGLGGQLNEEVDDLVGLTIKRSIKAIREGQTSPTDDKMDRMIATPEVTTGAAGTDEHLNKTSRKKNVLGRLMDRILKRDKKEAKTINDVTGGSTNTSDGEKKKSASKAHNKRDWIRRNLLCCFIRQTATVEPLFE